MAAKLSGSGGGRYDVQQNHSINVTPFVDVMLVLLIIFMVAAPLAAVTIKIHLPPETGVKPARKPNQIVYISIKKDGRIFVGDNATDLDDLGTALKSAIGGRSPATERIFIRGDQDLLYEDFMGVMNKMQDNGFYSVALVGEDKSGMKR